MRSVPSAAAIGRGQRRLADAGLALEEQRPAEPQGEEQRHGQPAVADIVLLGETLLEIGNGPGHGGVCQRRAGQTTPCSAFVTGPTPL